MEKIGPCKKCGERNAIVSKATPDGRFRIRCRTCGQMLVSESSPDEVIAQWNTWEDAPQPPPNPNIPVSPDGRFQIYQLKVRKDGVEKIMYAVPCWDITYSCQDSIHENLDDAVAEAEKNRRLYEEKEKRKIEEKRLLERRADERKKREDMRGFTDGLPPIRRGQIIRFMQRKWFFTGVEKPMTMRDFIHLAHIKKNPEMAVKNCGRSGTKKKYYVNNEEVGKTAYEYLEYLIKNKIKIKE